MSAQLFVSLVVILVVANAILGATAYLIFLERKVASWAQDRLGPNRTNFSFGILPIPENWRMFGLGQALADGLKLLIKEDYDPPHADRRLFLLAPALVVIPAMLGWAVIPWGGTINVPEFTIPLIGMTVYGGPVSVAVAPVNIGVIYILAIGSLAVYGLVLGAYASNNKYSFLGGLRATAQMLSYEIPMGLCVLMMILLYKTPSASLMSDLQATTGGAWGIFLHPLLAVIFFITLLAESNRAPFDLAEAEQELVGGFHTEYSSMKWALFFLAEYMHMITGSAFFTVLFLGGWDVIPFVGVLPSVVEAGSVTGILLILLKAGIFAGKIGTLIFIMMWVRWTLPRLRFDQLMKLAWRDVIPICLVMLLVVSVLTMIKAPLWAYPVANAVVAIGATVILPRLPQGPPVNRRVPLAGSRFSPLKSEA